MSETMPKVQLTLPRTVKLNDGEITLRLMIPADGPRVCAFARTLPEDDLLFLRMDITKLNVVNHWAQNIKEGRTVTVLAEAGKEIVGYASLHHNEVTWQRHIGEIRMQVGSRYRSRGVGRVLGAEIFSLAGALELRKIIAQMTADQKAALATLERLGFRREAVLHDFVMDRAGQTRDLIVTSYDVIPRTAEEARAFAP
jgi:RimJ/RimL family protein N-acetyltransferase